LRFLLDRTNELKACPEPRGRPFVLDVNICFGGKVGTRGQSDHEEIHEPDERALSMWRGLV